MGNLKDYIKVLESGSRQKGGAVKEGVPSLGGEHLNSMGGFDLGVHKLKYVSKKHFEKMKTGRLKKRDILVVKDGATTGKTSFVDENFPFIKAAINEHVFLLRTKDNLLPKYLFHYFKSEMGQRGILNDFRGATVGGISRNFIDMEMFIPSETVQEQIVEAIDQANFLIEKRKLQIEKLDLLIKSQFVEMFGDLVKNTRNWKIEQLSEHLNVVGGFAFKSDMYVERGVPVLKIGNINAGYFKNINLSYWEEDFALAKYEVMPGDLLMSLTGTVGKDDYGNVCIIGNNYEKYYLNQRNAKLDLYKTLNKYYLAYALKIPEVKGRLTRISRGVRQANISNKDIQSLSLPIPPIELQIQFADFVNKVEKTKATLQQSLTKMEQNYKSLMQKCFRGEIF